MAVVIAVWMLHGVLLLPVAWVIWCAKGTKFILVNSDSPVWHGYVQENIQPLLPESSIVMNWSDRRNWPWYSLKVILVRYFGGHREFNPMVINIQPFRWPRCFRFWKAFRDYKHGNPDALQSREQELLDYLDSQGIGTAF